jgi:hypothetical protein
VSLIWLIPSVVAVVAAIVTAAAARSMQQEVAALEASLRHLQPMADQSRSVRQQVARTARGTDRTLDSLGAARHR